MNDSHRWRSELLGERIELDLPSGRLEAFRRGDGPLADAIAAIAS